MKFTSVRYAFNLQPSLKKYNSSSEYRLSQKALWILFVIEYFGSFRGVSNNEIALYLKRHGHTTNAQVIRRKVGELKLEGLIQRTQGAIIRHKVTVAGRNELTEIEGLLRKRKPVVVRRKRNRRVQKDKSPFQPKKRSRSGLTL